LTQRRGSAKVLVVPALSAPTGARTHCRVPMPEVKRGQLWCGRPTATQEGRLEPGVESPSAAGRAVRKSLQIRQVQMRRLAHLIRDALADCGMEGPRPATRASSTWRLREPSVSLTPSTLVPQSPGGSGPPARQAKAKSATKPGALTKIERFFFEIIPAHGYTSSGRKSLASRR